MGWDRDYGSTGGDGIDSQAAPSFPNDREKDGIRKVLSGVSCSAMRGASACAGPAPVAVCLRLLLSSALLLVLVLLALSLLPVRVTAATLVLFAIFKVCHCEGSPGCNRPRSLDKKWDCACTFSCIDGLTGSRDVLSGSSIVETGGMKPTEWHIRKLKGEEARLFRASRLRKV